MKFFTCISIELDEIRVKQRLRVPPAQIRENLDIRMNSRNSYYHRSSINEYKKESLMN